MTNSSWWQRFPQLILVILAVGVYASSVFNQFIWDDEQFIYRNQFVLTFNVPALLTENVIAGAGEVSNYYRPLTSLSFALDHLIWGLRPFGFHLTNIGLHVIAGLGVYHLLWLLSPSSPRSHSIVFYRQWQWWVSLFFLIHPVQTEAVSYINSRGDSFFAALLVWALWLLIRSWQSQPVSWRWQQHHISLSATVLRVVSVLLLWLAISAKELGVIGAPLAVLCTLGWKVHHPAPIKSQWRTFAGWLAVWLGSVIFYFGLRATVLNFANSFDFYNGESAYAQSITLRLATFARAWWSYQQLVVLPFPLHMERKLAIEQSLLSVWSLAAIVESLLVGLISYWEWKRLRTAWVAVGSWWYLISLAPVSGIVPINGLIYEHWLYVPQIGWWTMVVGLIFFARSFLSTHHQRWLKWLLIGLLVAVSSIYGLLTIRQNYLWGNPIRFYTYTLRYTSSTRLYNNLGMAYADQGQYQQALTAYQQAITIDPGYPHMHHNMGNTYEQMGEIPQAIAAYEEALRIQPDFYHSAVNLARLYLNDNQSAKALPWLLRLHQQFPQEIVVTTTAYQLAAELGNASVAAQLQPALRTAIRDNPALAREIQEILATPMATPSSQQQ